MNTLRKQSGISLVEVLVSLVISLFLLAGIVQVYLGNKTTFAFTNALAEIQENARFALDTMSQDMRLAGEWGCVVPNYKSGTKNNINDTLSAATVPGFDANVHDFLGNNAIAGTNNTGLNGSDTITLMGGKPGQTNVENPFRAKSTQNIVTNAVSTIGANDIILVARCGLNDSGIVEADILRVTSVTPFSGNTQRQINVSANKSNDYQNDASVLELQTAAYTIAAGTGPAGNPSLWRSEFGTNQELVEGVDDMQILYGVDSGTNGYPNQYVTSDLVADFDDVVAIRVALLVSSIDDFVAEVPQTYTFNGTITTPGDRRIRQVFTTTIALRNRIGREDQ